MKRKTQFASGAVLLTCRDKEAVERLHSLLPNIPDVTVKPAPLTRRHTIRIHHIPDTTTEEKILLDVTDRLGEAPTGVIFVPYRDPKFEKQRIAICEVTPEAYKKATTVRSIWVGWRQCRLESSPYIGRCPRCGLLGHSLGHCSMPEDSVDSMPSVESSARTSLTCRDCTAYNQRLKGMAQSRPRRRPYDHKTGWKLCPTLLKLRYRSLPSKPTPSGGLEVDPVT